jgi:hypothetical protein
VLLSARAVPDALPCVRCDFVEARRARGALRRGPSLARHAPALAATDRSPAAPPPRRPAAPRPRGRDGGGLWLSPADGGARLRTKVEALDASGD